MRTMTDVVGNTLTCDKSIKYAILNKVNDKILDISGMYSMMQLSFMSNDSIRDYTGEVMVLKHFEKFIDGSSKRECNKSMANILQYFSSNHISKEVTADKKAISNTDVKTILINRINDALYSLDMILMRKYDVLNDGITRLYKATGHNKLETSKLYAVVGTHECTTDNTEYETSNVFGTVLTDTIILSQVIVAIANNSNTDENYNSQWFNHRVVTVLEKLDSKLSDDELSLINTLDLSDVNKYM